MTTKRPPRRTKMVCIRLTAAEAGALTALAKADRRTLSDWMRLRCLDATGQGKQGDEGDRAARRDRHYLDTFLSEVDGEVVQ